MSYVWRPAWYERLEKWVDRDGDLDAGYRLFHRFESVPPTLGQDGSAPRGASL